MSDTIETLQNRRWVRADFARREREGRIGACEGAAIYGWDEAEKDAASLRRRVATLERRLARVLRLANLQRNSLAHGLMFSAEWQKKTWAKVGRVWSGRRRP